MIRAITREIRVRLAARKLARHVAKRKAELERRQFAKRSSASKLGWQRRKIA